MSIANDALVAQSVEHWTCDWQVAGLNLELEGLCETLAKVSALSFG